MASKPEQLVTVAEVAQAVGYAHAPEAITSRVGKHVVPYWDGSPALPFDIAAKVTADIRAEKAAYEREQYAAMNEQMDREQWEREYPLRAFEDALSHNRVDGVRVSVPGDPAPSWMGDQ